MAESVTTPTHLRPKSTNQNRANDLIQRRIASALSSKDNAELTQRVRRLERMAVLGTRPALSCFGATKFTEMCKKITLHRIIYSTPELKQQIEESVGTIGVRLPIDDDGVLLNVFNQKLASKKFVMVTRFAGLFVAFVIVVFSGYRHAFLFLIVGCVSIYVAHGLETRGLHPNHSQCCSCGISTKDAFRAKGGVACECSNCQGTGVCQVGCPSCCPYIIPKEVVVQRLDYLQVLPGNPHLQSRWKRAVDDEAIIVAQQDGGSGELSLDKENYIFAKSLENNPDLKQQLDAAVMEHQKNSGDIECNATAQRDEEAASDASAQNHSPSILDLPSVATDNLLDCTLPALRAQIINTNAGYAKVPASASKEL